MWAGSPERPRPQLSFIAVLTVMAEAALRCAPAAAELDRVEHPPKNVRVATATLPPVMPSTPPTEVATQAGGLARSGDGGAWDLVSACTRRRLPCSVLKIHGKLFIGFSGLAADGQMIPKRIFLKTEIYRALK